LEDIRNNQENWKETCRKNAEKKITKVSTINPLEKETELVPERDGKTKSWMKY
jgi:hypothetical protein